jgi:hypothetical protein
MTGPFVQVMGVFCLTLIASRNILNQIAGIKWQIVISGLGSTATYRTLPYVAARV